MSFILNLEEVSNALRVVMIAIFAIDTKLTRLPMLALKAFSSRLDLVITGSMENTYLIKLISNVLVRESLS